MLNKKTTIVIVGIAVAVIVIIAVLVALFISVNNNQTETAIPSPPPINRTTNTNAGNLPVSDSEDTNGSLADQISQIAKEQEFISSYYQPIPLSYQNTAPNYELPLNNIKEQVVNFRDFSRRIDTDEYLHKLAAFGFTAIESPFEQAPKNWEESYRLLKSQEVPIFISSDSVVGVYQDTMHIIFKEIEQERFYPSLWDFLNELYNDVADRYDARQQEFGIETDLITESLRLELAYLATALKLLSPEENQVEDTISSEKIFFTPAEADVYEFTIPPTLKNQVEAEIELITQKAKLSKSPILLYEKSYAQYTPPKQYQNSEKLKNYFLTITWLNDALFPLWSKANDCADCLLDEQDHRISFLAGLFLASDISNNQNLQNEWANIYKAISFFQGLETNLTYLQYVEVLEQLGLSENTIEQFDTNIEEVKNKITTIQQTIDALSFPEILGGTKDSKELQGLRLLRNQYVLEDRVFDQLTGSDLVSTVPKTTEQITGCEYDRTRYRCFPTGLDLLHLLDNTRAGMLLEILANNQFSNYSQRITKLASGLVTFNQNTWHDNAYLGLFEALRNTFIVSDNSPAFMTTQAWEDKVINSALSAWTNFHREVIIERVPLFVEQGFGSYFSYGYIEPQPEMYADLLATTRMLKEGLVNLEIISRASKSYDRLTRLELLLDEALVITQKELVGTELDPEEYNFISNFDREIVSITGDINKEYLDINFEHSYNLSYNRETKERIDGLDYIIAAYPDTQGNPVFAIGPIIRYSERQQDSNYYSEKWQETFYATQ